MDLGGGSHFHEIGVAKSSARAIFKCLIGVNNLWVEHCQEAVCHLISFHILIRIIFGGGILCVWFGCCF